MNVVKKIYVKAFFFFYKKYLFYFFASWLLLRISALNLQHRTFDIWSDTSSCTLSAWRQLVTTLLSGVKMMLCWLLVSSRLIPGFTLFCLGSPCFSNSTFSFQLQPWWKKIAKIIQIICLKTQNIWREIACFYFSFKAAVRLILSCRCSVL